MLSAARCARRAGKGASGSELGSRPLWCGPVRCARELCVKRTGAQSSVSLSLRRRLPIGPASTTYVEFQISLGRFLLNTMLSIILDNVGPTQHESPSAPSGHPQGRELSAVSGSHPLCFHMFVDCVRGAPGKGLRSCLEGLASRGRPAPAVSRQVEGGAQAGRSGLSRGWAVDLPLDPCTSAPTIPGKGRGVQGAG